MLRRKPEYIDFKSKANEELNKAILTLPKEEQKRVFGHAENVQDAWRLLGVQEKMLQAQERLQTEGMITQAAMLIGASLVDPVTWIPVVGMAGKVYKSTSLAKANVILKAQAKSRKIDRTVKAIEGISDAKKNAMKYAAAGAAMGIVGAGLSESVFKATNKHSDITSAMSIGAVIGMAGGGLGGFIGTKYKQRKIDYLSSEADSFVKDNIGDPYLEFPTTPEGKLDKVIFNMRDMEGVTIMPERDGNILIKKEYNGQELHIVTDKDGVVIPIRDEKGNLIQEHRDIAQIDKIIFDKIPFISQLMQTDLMKVGQGPSSILRNEVVKWHNYSVAARDSAGKVIHNKKNAQNIKFTQEGVLNTLKRETKNDYIEAVRDHGFKGSLDDLHTEASPYFTKEISNQEAKAYPLIKAKEEEIIKPLAKEHRLQRKELEEKQDLTIKDAETGEYRKLTDEESDNLNYTLEKEAEEVNLKKNINKRNVAIHKEIREDLKQRSDDGEFRTADADVDKALYNEAYRKDKASREELKEVYTNPEEEAFLLKEKEVRDYNAEVTKTNVDDVINKNIEEGKYWNPEKRVMPGKKKIEVNRLIKEDDKNFKIASEEGRFLNDPKPKVSEIKKAEKLASDDINSRIETERKKGKFGVDLKDIEDNKLYNKEIVNSEKEYDIAKKKYTKESETYQSRKKEKEAELLEEGNIEFSKTIDSDLEKYGKKARKLSEKQKAEKILADKNRDIMVNNELKELEDSFELSQEKSENKIISDKITKELKVLRDKGTFSKKKEALDNLENDIEDVIKDKKERGEFDEFGVYDPELEAEFREQTLNNIEKQKNRIEEENLIKNIDTDKTPEMITDNFEPELMLKKQKELEESKEIEITEAYDEFKDDPSVTIDMVREELYSEIPSELERLKERGDFSPTPEKDLSESSSNYKAEEDMLDYNYDKEMETRKKLEKEYGYSDLNQESIKENFEPALKKEFIEAEQKKLLTPEIKKQIKTKATKQRNKDIKANLNKEGSKEKIKEQKKFTEKDHEEYLLKQAMTDIKYESMKKSSQGMFSPDATVSERTGKMSSNDISTHLDLTLKKAFEDDAISKIDKEAIKEQAKINFEKKKIYAEDDAKKSYMPLEEVYKLEEKKASKSIYERANRLERAGKFSPNATIVPSKGVDPVLKEQAVERLIKKHSDKQSSNNNTEFNNREVERLGNVLNTKYKRILKEWELENTPKEPVLKKGNKLKEESKIYNKDLEDARRKELEAKAKEKIEKDIEKGHYSSKPKNVKSKEDTFRKAQEKKRNKTIAQKEKANDFAAKDYKKGKKSDIEADRKELIKKNSKKYKKQPEKEVDPKIINTKRIKSSNLNKVELEEAMGNLKKEQQKEKAEARFKFEEKIYSGLEVDFAKVDTIPIPFRNTLNHYKEYYQTSLEAGKNNYIEELQKVHKGRLYRARVWDFQLLQGKFDKDGKGLSVDEIKTLLHAGISNHPNQMHLNAEQIKEAVDYTYTQLQMAKFDSTNMSSSIIVGETTRFEKHLRNKKIQVSEAHLGPLIKDNLIDTVQAHNYDFSGYMAQKSVTKDMTMKEYTEDLKRKLIDAGEYDEKSFAGFNNVIQDSRNVLRMNPRANEQMWTFTRNLQTYNNLRVGAGFGGNQYIELMANMFGVSFDALLSGHFKQSFTDVYKLLYKDGKGVSELTETLITLGGLDQALHKSRNSRYGDVTNPLKITKWEKKGEDAVTGLMKYNGLSYLSAVMENLAGASIVTTMRKINKAGYKNRTNAEDAMLARIGIDQRQFENLMLDLEKHTDLHSGKFDLESFSQYNRDTLQYSMQNAMSEMVIKGSSMHLPLFMKTGNAFIKAITQYLSYPMIAHELILRKGWTEDQANLFANTIGGIMGFMMIKYTKEQAMIAAGFMEKEDAKYNYFDSANGKETIVRTIKESGNLLPTAGNLALYYNIIGDMVGYKHLGGDKAYKTSPGAAIGGIPYDLAEKVGIIAKGIAGGDVSDYNVAKALQGVAPFYTVPMYKEGLDSLISENFNKGKPVRSSSDDDGPLDKLMNSLLGE